MGTPGARPNSKQFENPLAKYIQETVQTRADRSAHTHKRSYIPTIITSTTVMTTITIATIIIIITNNNNNTHPPQAA